MAKLAFPISPPFFSVPVENLSENRMFDWYDEWMIEFLLSKNATKINYVSFLPKLFLISNVFSFSLFRNRGVKSNPSTSPSVWRKEEKTWNSNPGAKGHPLRRSDPTRTDQRAKKIRNGCWKILDNHEIHWMIVTTTDSEIRSAQSICYMKIKILMPS